MGEDGTDNYRGLIGAGGWKAEQEMLYMPSHCMASTCSEDRFLWHSALRRNHGVLCSGGGVPDPALPCSPVGKTSDTYQYRQRGASVQQLSQACLSHPRGWRRKPEARSSTPLLTFISCGFTASCFPRIIAVKGFALRV